MSNANFSRDWFNKCDAKGKKLARSLLECLGAYGIEETKSNSKYDIGAKSDGKDVKIEVEIKQDWGTKWKVEGDADEWKVNGQDMILPFPFGDIRFAARKKDNPVDYYVTFSGCGKYAMMAPSEDVKKSKISRINNKHMSNEPFMVFKLSSPNRFAFFRLDDKGWSLVHHWCGRVPKVLTLNTVFDLGGECLLDL